MILLSAAILLPFLLIAFVPWQVVRLVVVPLGLPRAAYHIASIADWVWRVDRAGGALLAGAWALCRSGPAYRLGAASAGARDDEAADWLENKLSLGIAPGISGPGFPQSPLCAGGVAAAALLAAYRGDLAGARTLFESVETFDERACPPEARRVAAGWLAAEAASRGDWQAVLRLAAPGRGCGRDVWLLGGVAARLLGDASAPSDTELWLRWALAPHRAATRALVQRALTISPGDPRPAPEEPEVRAARVADGDLWSRAVLLHAALLLRRGRRIAGDDLRRLGGAWDAAFEDDGALDEVRERARSIGAPSPEIALAPLRRAVEEDLAAVARAARIPREDWEDLGETIGRATQLLRDELLSEIEIACDASRRRVDEGRELSPVDEWREWIALRAQYDSAAAIVGIELRRLAFAKAHPDVCHLAVWLHNTRKQRPIANVMFRWLLAEAEALGDTRAADLQRKNVDCGF